jgi:ornithine cyclodeaminase
MKIISLAQIREVLPSVDLVNKIEKGFAAYSRGKAVVPPVGELLLEKGEVHIKYGFIENDAYYVIKIASGFYENPRIGLSSSNGLMLLFKQETGEPAAILLDEGYLTDVRTAVAGAIAAKYLAPKEVKKIGIVGTGIQARLQLRYLKSVINCREALVWGRGEKQLSEYREAMENEGFAVETTLAAEEILPNCNLVVTTTPSETPLLFADRLRPGTHLTAVGSDTPRKQELDSEILAKADLIVADSIAQCLVRGEIYRAISAGKITKDKPVELGNIISGIEAGRTTEDQITIADLTGVAVQDMMIAKAVFEASS